MKKKFRKIAASALALTLAAANVVMPQSPISDMVTEISASAASESGTYNYGGTTCSYTIDNGYAKLDAVVSTSSSAVILPTTIPHNGVNYTVTSIEKDFAKGLNVRTITLPTKVKSIGGNFARSSLITTVIIPSTVVEIGYSFCKDCTNLRSVSYSGTALKELGEGAFKNTPFIAAPNSKGAVTMGQWLIKYLGTASYVNVLGLNNNKPDITKIAEDAFKSNTTLKSVNLNGVEIVGDKAFWNCTNLATISSPYALYDVGSYAFYNTKWISTNKNANGHVILGRTLINYNSTGAATIDLTVSDFDNVQYIANNALRDAAKKATTLKLPNSIVSVDRYAMNVSNTTSTVKNIYLYGSKITANNFNQYASFLENNFEAFSNTAWGADMAKSKAKSILSSLGIAYVGTGDKGTYNAFKEYQIAQKLYDYVGKTYNYKYYVDGGSSCYIEEMFFNKGIVCVDYAELYMYLLESAGVNAELVGSSTHQWNVIEIGGDWYHADTCWYDRQTMFMINDNTIVKETHSHSSFSYDNSPIIPSTMDTLSDVPWCYYQMGDVTRDGKVNSADVTKLNKYLLGSTTLASNALYLGDVNRDGSVDAFDLAQLKSMI